MITVRAPAKLNLRLEVIAKEASGYHQLETLFCALELADEIAIEPGGTAFTLEVRGAPELAASADNLVLRAAHAFRAATGITDGAHFTLHKHIPHGAGLGGGSSDAAAILLALDRLHGQPLGAVRRLELGAALGSDVPFFLSEAMLALAWGRGGRVLPLEPLPARDVLLVVPETRTATAEAYAALTVGAVRPRVLGFARYLGWDDVASSAYNDFEAVVLPRIPELERARDVLRGHGALMTLLTGSGSVYYGVFDDAARVRAAEAALRALGLRTIGTRTACAAAPPSFIP